MMSLASCSLSSTVIVGHDHGTRRYAEADAVRRPPESGVDNHLVSGES